MFANAKPAKGVVSTEVTSLKDPRKNWASPNWLNPGNYQQFSQLDLLPNAKATFSRLLLCPETSTHRSRILQIS